MTFAFLNLYVQKVLVLGSVTLTPAVELNGTSLLVLLKLQGCFLQKFNFPQILEVVSTLRFS